MNQLRPQAERLREQGYSYAMIHAKLGISKSTLSYWFRNRPFQANLQVVDRIKYGPLKSAARRHDARIAEVAAMRELGIAQIGSLSKRDLWLLGLGLYIGEGAKTIETLSISNSDPAVIAIAVRWFKEICGLSSDNLAIRLHLYPDSEEEASLTYWQGVTGLPRENFYRSHIDRRGNKARAAQGKLPHGTAHIRVIAKGDREKGVRLYRKVVGWIDGALNQV